MKNLLSDSQAKELLAVKELVVQSIDKTEGIKQAKLVAKPIQPNIPGSVEYKMLKKVRDYESKIYDSTPAEAFISANIVIVYNEQQQDGTSIKKEICAFAMNMEVVSDKSDELKYVTFLIRGCDFARMSETYNEVNKSSSEFADYKGTCIEAFMNICLENGLNMKNYDEHLLAGNTWEFGMYKSFGNKFQFVSPSHFSNMKRFRSNRTVTTSQKPNKESL